MDIGVVLAIPVDDPVPFIELSQEAVTTIGVVAVIILIMLSAFFASAEIAIFSLADHRIGALVEEGTSGAETLQRLKSEPRTLLVTILVGNNIANIGMSSITTGLLGMYLDPGQAVLIATFGVTSLVLLFGESAPKSYAVENSEPWALRISRPLNIAKKVMYPLVVFFDALTKVVNKAMGSSGEFENAYVTRSEVREVITAGQRAGIFTDEEHQMLQRLLRFRNRIVKEVMVPRLDVVAVDVETDVDTAIETCLEREVNQIPVYDEVLDSVVGVVHIRELLAASYKNGDQPLQTVVREPYVVPETKDVDELLTELRAERERIAIVVDEFGTTAGIVTIEDIVEEIIGDILTDTEAPPIRWLDDRTALVRGELNVHEANAELGTDLSETSEFETVAGLILAQAGRLVKEGEGVTYDGTRLVVETAGSNRILEVRVELPEPVTNSDENEERASEPDEKTDADE